jgi:hypothetical protein
MWRMKRLALRENDRQADGENGSVIAASASRQFFSYSAASREFRVDVNGKTSRRAKNCCGAHCKLAVANHFSISKDQS